MALNTYRNNPEYPDRYTRSKGWTKVLPVKGRPIQSAELIEIQSIIQDNLKQGFNTIFKNGSAIDGLRISVASRSLQSVNLTISAGKIYIEGVILDTPFTELTVPTEGIYDIYVQVNESIITEVEDSNLRDPIRGAYSLGMPGASRLVWTATVNFIEEGVVVTNSYAIGQCVNGVVLQKDLNPFFEVQKILSKFIYERSGNFCVEGLNTSYIGLSRRSVSNTNKYEELQNQLNNAKNNQQNILAQALRAQQLIAELNNQYTQAQQNLLNNGSAENLATIGQINSALSTAKADFATYSSELVSAQSALQAAQNSITSSENLLTDQQIISISPGIAYVEGFRVAINSPTQLFIPQSLPTTSVSSATYTYRGIQAQSIRNFSLDGATINQPIAPDPNPQYTELTIQINNIDRNINFTPQITTNNFNITFTYKITELLTLDEILSNVFSEFNQNNATSNPELDNLTTIQIFDNQVVGIPPEITVQDGINGSPAMTKDVVRTILKNYITVTRPDTPTLSFQATAAVLNGDETNIVIQTRRKLLADDTEVSPFTDLTVDVEAQVLNQPIPTSTYRLAFRPVNQIEKLVATLTANNISIIRGAQEGGSDELPDDTVVDIVSVVEPGVGGRVYINNKDFRLNGNSIQWLGVSTAVSPAAVAPTPGTSYLVTFTYTEPLSLDTDYILNRDRDTIEFIGRTPDPNSQFTVDYTYYLSKAGLITLDKSGRLNYILSAAAKNPVVPAAPPNLLILASFIMSLNNIQVNQIECKRQTVEDLYDLAEKIKRNTRNNAALRLDLETFKGAIASGVEPVGVYTEAILDFSKIDEDNTTAYIIPSIQGFMVGANVDEKEVLYQTGSSTTVVVNNDFNVADYVMIPYTEVSFFKQPRATTTRPITKISPTINKRGRLYINKPVLFLNEGESNLSPCDQITRAGNNFFNQNLEVVPDVLLEIQDNVRNTFGSTGQAIVDSIESGLPITINNTNNNKDFLVRAFDDVKVKPITLQIKAEGLPPLTNGFKLYLDKTQYSDYTLVNGTVSSIQIGTLDGEDGFQIKADGTAELLVRIPTDLSTGTHTLSIEKQGAGFCKANFYCYNNLVNHLTLSPLKAWNAIPLRVASSKQIPLQREDMFSENITSLGIDPALTANVVDPSITVIQNNESSYPTKAFALNQTFTSVNDYYLTSVKLKIASQPVGNNDELYVFLTNAGADLPRKEIKGKATASSYTDTNVALGVPGIDTTFSFKTPQLINRNNKYNIGLESYTPTTTTSDYEIYTAVIDDFDIITNTTVGEQLYLDGDLLTSQDGSTFYFESKEDLTMELMRAEFDTSTYYIANLGIYTSSTPIDYFCLNTRDVVPISTEVIYKYKAAGSSDPFTPFKPNLMICLDSEVSGVEIQAELRTNVSTLSPMVLINGSSVSLYATKTSGLVSNKLVTYDEYYTKVFVTFEYIKPAGTNIQVSYSPTRGFVWEGTEWFNLTEVPNSTIVINEELQLYQTTYTRDAGNDTAGPTDPEGKFYVFREERKFFRYRVQLTANGSISPLVRKIQTYVTR